MKRLVALLAVVVWFIPVSTFADVSRGSEGAVVTEVQTILKGYGYTIVVDGEFGPQTEKAVRSWQKSNGLLVDGIVGPVTLNSLRSATRMNNATQVTPTLPPPPQPTKPEHYDTWLRLAVCESGSRWEYNGSSGYDGGLQFSPRTWTAMGGGEFAQYAWQASMIEQMIVAERTLDVQGWKAWPTCSRKLGLR